MRFLFLITIVFFSCTEEFNLELDKSAKKLVVDGLITNSNGPYYVRLTWSNNNLSVLYDTVNGLLYSKTEAAIGAVVIIKDNHENVDTLFPSQDYYEYYKYRYDSLHNVIDSVKSIIENSFGGKRGYYMTKKLKGISGYQYNLYVKIENKEYSSSCYMPVLPPIDSLSILEKYSEIKKTNYYVPLIYFQDPSKERNFYLFQLFGKGINHYNSNYLPEDGSSDSWNYSVISDEFLQSNLNGLDIESGSSVKNIPLYRYFPGDTVIVSVQSITEETYTFYKNLISQLKNDGAAFKPVPASPKGNISNGALGLFRASSVIELRKKVPDLSNKNVLPMRK
jgi:hypothetical protein